MKNKDSANEGSGTVDGSSRGALVTIVILVVLLIVGQLVWEKYFPPADKPGVEKKTTIEATSKIVHLVPGGQIIWTAVPRGMCYEVSLAKEGECITTHGNTDSATQTLCQGRRSGRLGPIFRIGLSSDHETVAGVDLFPCN